MSRVEVYHSEYDDCPVISWLELIGFEQKLDRLIVALAAQLQSRPSLAEALEAYEADRKPNTDALADLAIDNFREMRDRVASPLFLFRKKFEKFLNQLMPQRYIPLYPMISFTRIPYAEARERAVRQWRIVRTAFGVTGLVLFLVVLEKLWPR